MNRRKGVRAPFRALQAQASDGTECFHKAGSALPFDLLSFWQWSASDLLDNTTRGVLAEYLVGRAVGADLTAPRQPWSPFDLRTPDGWKLEVKASAFLQAWGQVAPSAPTFDIARKQAWNHAKGRYEGLRDRHADVYVFALLAHQDKRTLDPLDVEQWRFFVVPTREIERAHGDRQRVGLAQLRKLARESSWLELASAIGMAADMGEVDAGQAQAIRKEPVAPSTPREAPRFGRYIGIDYSGAQTPTASLPGLRVYLATRDAQPHEVQPPPSPRKYWTRREVAEWLVRELSVGEPALVGIDHGFSFPLAYFERHRLPHDWPGFLDDFQRHWPTDGDHVYVDFVRDGSVGDGKARSGNRRWRRLTEWRAGGAKSVFHFDVQGSVAKSTHAGLPWLRYLRRELGERVHFWPFDGWSPRADRSVIAEVYPSLWSRPFPREGRNSHQHDAWVVAEMLRGQDAGGRVDEWLKPSLSDAERKVASIEGWILGAK